MTDGKEWRLSRTDQPDPITLEQMKDLARGGKLLQADKVRKGTEPWIPAGEVRELVPCFATPPRGTEEPPGAARPSEETPRRSSPAARQEPPRVLGLEPMIPKYFSPVDLLAAAAYAFDPRKLLFTALTTIPLLALAFLLEHLADQTPVAFLGIALALLMALTPILGLAFVLSMLAFITRRQLEGAGYTVAEVATYVASHVKTALLWPAVTLLPASAAYGVVWCFGSIRNTGEGAAAVMNLLYIVPMMFALVSVAGLLLYVLGTGHLTAAAAIEGRRLGGAAKALWDNTRHQKGRVILHWLIQTVAWGVIGFVCLGLVIVATHLPLTTPLPTQHSAKFEVMIALYQAIAWGLALALPLSLFATLAVLSYMTLRHPAGVPLAAPGRPEETSAPEIAPVQAPARVPDSGETQPLPEVDLPPARPEPLLHGEGPPKSPSGSG